VTLGRVERGYFSRSILHRILELMWTIIGTSNCPEGLRYVDEPRPILNYASNNFPEMRDNFLDPIAKLVMPAKLGDRVRSTVGNRLAPPKIGREVKPTISLNLGPPP
jgi:hypothetical protein